MISVADIGQALALDAKDPLHSYRDQFHIPQHDGQDCIYLCGNSLGLQPKNARAYVEAELDDWAALGVEGHFHARHPWMPYHEFLTENMARVVGAKPVEVVVMNSLTVNLHLLFVSFYRPAGARRKIVVESDIFPSDLYAVESQIRFHGGNPAEDLTYWSPREGEHVLRYDDLEAMLEREHEHIALIWLGGVNYYTGQAFDLKRIVAMGHRFGVVVGFDLAHGAGNIAYDLHGSGADFAAWCSYKYLNSSPGGLSGIFVHEKHARSFDLPRFAGWWGHNKETRFSMRDPFDPLPGAEGWQLSNPPILPLAVMRASLELFVEAGMPALRAKSVKLTTYLYRLIKEQVGSAVHILTPERVEDRGCQLSLLVPSNGRRIFDFLAKNGVIADWREPDVVRVAPVPLYNTFEDAWRFVQILTKAVKETAV